jgi:hypothetical protein
MQQIVSFFWQMCLLRQNPENLPSNRFNVGLILFFYVVIALIAVALTRSTHSPLNIVGIVFIGVSIQATLTWSVLAFKKLTQRFTATWASLLGTNSFMLVILVPVNLLLLNTENQSLILLADSISWICLGWWLAIAGHIYHKAVNISLLQGSAIAFLTELLSVMATITLFPQA